MDEFMIVINAILCKFNCEMILEGRFIILWWFGGQWISFHAYIGKLFHCLYSCSLLGNGCNSSLSLGFDPWCLAYVVLMSILCIFQSLAKVGLSWMLWATLYISTAVWQGNKSRFAAFYGILVVMWISIIFSSVIQFILCLYVPSSLFFYITKWINIKGWNPLVF